MAYIVVNVGYEYNDETYDIGRGDGMSVDRHVYKDQDDAVVAARQKLRAILGDRKYGGFTIGDFGYDPISYEYSQAWAWMQEAGYEDDTYGRDATWAEFIDWADQNGIDWYNAVPALVNIYEVEYID